MPRFLVSYDLRKPGRNYDELIKAIKALGSWCHPLESVWLLDLSREFTTTIIINALKKHIDANDQMLVILTEAKVWSTVNVDDAAVKWLNS